MAVVVVAVAVAVVVPLQVAPHLVVLPVAAGPPLIFCHPTFHPETVHRLTFDHQTSHRLLTVGLLTVGLFAVRFLTVRFFAVRLLAIRLLVLGALIPLQFFRFFSILAVDFLTEFPGPFFEILLAVLQTFPVGASFRVGADTLLFSKQEVYVLDQFFEPFLFFFDLFGAIFAP